MFPTTLQHPYAPRGRRRGRNDPNSRDFICPCGKSYLSYPALFTHIKIKHNGRAPGQIIKPKSQNPSKRGRPRQKQVYDSDSDTNDIAANCIDRLCDFVTQFEKPQQSMCSRLKDLYMKDAFYRVYVDYNPQEQQARYNERQDLYEQYSDNVFCQLIAEVNKRLNEPYHIDSVIVMLMLLGHFVNDGTVTGENMVERRREGEQEDYEDDGYGQNQEQYENQRQGNQQIVEQQQYHSSSQQQHRNNSHIKNTHIEVEKTQKKGQQSQKNQIQQEKQSQQQFNTSKNQRLTQKNNQQLEEEENAQQLQEIQQNNDQTLLKLKHQPIRNIVNYVNDFIINYKSKYYNSYHLQDYQFFLQSNVKIFLQLFFNWLTMKKYVGYKVKINQHYQ